jgi:hypothetical protein
VVERGRGQVHQQQEHEERSGKAHRDFGGAHGQGLHGDGGRQGAQGFASEERRQSLCREFRFFLSVKF